MFHSQLIRYEGQESEPCLLPDFKTQEEFEEYFKNENEFVNSFRGSDGALTFGSDNELKVFLNNLMKIDAKKYGSTLLTKF